MCNLNGSMTDMHNEYSQTLIVQAYYSIVGLHGLSGTRAQAHTITIIDIECLLKCPSQSWMVHVFYDCSAMFAPILSSQVVSLPLQSEVANFCAAMDTLIDQDGLPPARVLIRSAQCMIKWHYNKTAVLTVMYVQFKYILESHVVGCSRESCMHIKFRSQFICIISRELFPEHFT